jgi:hypothetical protein
LQTTCNESDMEQSDFKGKGQSKAWFVQYIVSRG